MMMLLDNLIKILRPIVAIGLLAFIISACNKYEEDIYGNFEPFLGNWTAKNLQIQKIDQDSNIWDTSINNLGTVEFLKDPETDAEPGLSPLLYNSTDLEEYGPLAYLRTKVAIEDLLSGKHQCYWFPDVAAKRVYIWGISPGASYVQVAQIDSHTENELVLRNYYDDFSSYNVSFSERHILTLTR
ncbi:MAG: hypothetical protein KDC92_10000 [Bacteroidetes bacterium]|nr:hypothetical protein [Bacteroidota bacterium]